MISLLSDIGDNSKKWGQAITMLIQQLRPNSEPASNLRMESPLLYS